MADNEETNVATRRKLRKRLDWWWTRKVTLRVYSARNWLKGYRFGWVQRHRCCHHTTPAHYPGCMNGGPYAP